MPIRYYRNIPVCCLLVMVGYLDILQKSSFSELPVFSFSLRRQFHARLRVSSGPGAMAHIHNPNTLGG